MDKGNDKADISRREKKYNRNSRSALSVLMSSLAILPTDESYTYIVIDEVISITFSRRP